MDIVRNFLLNKHYIFQSQLLKKLNITLWIIKIFYC